MDGGEGLGQNPFGALSSAGLPVAPKVFIQPAAASAAATGKGRLEAGRRKRRIADGWISNARRAIVVEKRLQLYPDSWGSGCRRKSNWRRKCVRRVAAAER